MYTISRKATTWKSVFVGMKVTEVSLRKVYFIPPHVKEVPWNPLKFREADLVSDRTQKGHLMDTGNPF